MKVEREECIKMIEGKLMIETGKSWRVLRLVASIKDLVNIFLLEVMKY